MNRKFIKCLNCNKNIRECPSQRCRQCYGVFIKKPLDERFFKFVKKTSTCWIWTGHITRYGYFGTMPGKVCSAHRISWEIHNGPIPIGMCILHKCDNTICVNPRHLFIGTHLDNMRDKVSKKRYKVGSQTKASKLTEKDIIHIRKIYSQGKTRKQISKIYPICKTSIANIINNKTWCHV